MNDSIVDVLAAAVALAKKKGAAEVGASATRSREVEMSRRDGKQENIKEALSLSMQLRLFVDGRYSVASTSDLRLSALDGFVDNAMSTARALAKDPFRSLPDAILYEGRASTDLQVFDASQPQVTAKQRQQVTEEIEAAARATPDAKDIISVAADWDDAMTERFLIHSNGLNVSSRSTSFGVSCQVSMKGADGRRPEDSDFARARYVNDLPPVAQLGRTAVERAASLLNATKGPSAVLPMLVDARVAGNLVRSFMGALVASSIQQKRSFLDGKVGQSIGSALFDLRDNPHLPKGFGSRLFDGEGLAAKPFVLFDKGVLKNFYTDTYYGKKAQLQPTTGGPSNITFVSGSSSVNELMAQMKEGIYVTGFLGGNSNSTTGDFSNGIRGFRIRNGKRAEALTEMNIAGNHLELWKSLVAVGNDPFAYSPMRSPTLLFDKMQFAGA